MTTIEWVARPGTTPETWNPVTGCSRGCSYCYARDWARRLKGMGVKKYRDGFKPTFHENVLDKPLHWRKPRTVFVSSMGDIMDPAFDDAQIHVILTVAGGASKHTFQFLTKRPERLADFNPWPDNCWVGATATDQEMAEDGLRGLNNVRAHVRFLSCEPYLSAMCLPLSTYPVDWVILGAMTGPKPRRPSRTAFEDLVADVRRYKIPVFVKDNVPWTGPRPQEWPKGEK